MYRLVSNIDDYSVRIAVMVGDSIITMKRLHVDLTGNRVPTFSPNYYEYNNDEFTQFIRHVEMDEIAIFAFDNDNENSNYDGMSYGNNVLLITTSYSQNTHSTFLHVTDESRTLLVADLKALQELILQIIKIRIDLADELEEKVEDSDED